MLSKIQYYFESSLFGVYSFDIFLKQNRNKNVIEVFENTITEIYKKPFLMHQCRTDEVYRDSSKKIVLDFFSLKSAKIIDRSSPGIFGKQGQDLYLSFLKYFYKFAHTDKPHPSDVWRDFTHCLYKQYFGEQRIEDLSLLYSRLVDREDPPFQVENFSISTVDDILNSEIENIQSTSKPWLELKIRKWGQCWSLCEISKPFSRFALVDKIIVFCVRFFKLNFSKENGFRLRTTDTFDIDREIDVFSSDTVNFEKVNAFFFKHLHIEIQFILGTILERRNQNSQTSLGSICWELKPRLSNNGHVLMGYKLSLNDRTDPRELDINYDDIRYQLVDNFHREHFPVLDGVIRLFSAN